MNEKRLIEIGEDLATHVLRPIATGGQLDKVVLRHWAIKFLESKRELDRENETKETL